MARGMMTPGNGGPQYGQTIDITDNNSYQLQNFMAQQKQGSRVGSPTAGDYGQTQNNFF
jgi:hypothetical protein